MEDKNIIIEELRCVCCDMTFKLKTDLKRHSKTNKHLKKSLGLHNCECKHCDYKTDDKSNMKRHIKINHPEALEKAKTKVDNLKDDKIPKLIMKEYTLMKDGLNMAYFSAMGSKHRIKHLINRRFREDEMEVIEAKKLYKEKSLYYNDCLRKIKDIEEKYPDIIQAYTPTLKPDSDDIEEDYDKGEQLEKDRKAKLEKLEDIKDEVEILYDILKAGSFDDLNHHKAEIKKKEDEYKALVKVLYK